ncbi:response regulator transcription factor [Roseateles sp.]|uniref:response regulator transcription factor n=1 Tax=Roseateles sp. TaxID=1971397 RepID=UPI003263814C
MKVLLIDDHPLFREGIALLLRPLVQPLEVLQAGSFEEARGLLDDETDVDLILIDLGLPGVSGMQGLLHLRVDFPAVPVVVVSANDDRETVLATLDAGAMGFIPKSSTPQVMIAALRLILDHGIYLPPKVFMSSQAPLPAPVLATRDAAAPDVAGRRRTAADLGLTSRQAEVLHLLLQGLPAKLIGRQLDLSISTVKAHTTAVLRALNVTSRTQAVVAAGRLGLRFDRQDGSA